MRALMSIGLLLLIVLLGFTILDKLGAGDVTEKVGDYVKAKAGVPSGSGGTSPDGLPGSGGQAATLDENARYVRDVLGWDLRDLQDKPLEAVRRGIARIDAEIARLKELRMQARVQANRAKDDHSEESEELETKRAWMKEAMEVLDNPETVYPARVGGYEYTEDMLLTAINSTGERIEALKATQSFGGANLVARAEEALATIQTTMELLVRTKTLLEQQAKWFETANTVQDANAAKSRAGEFKRRAEAILTGEDVAEEVGGTGTSPLARGDAMRPGTARAWTRAAALAAVLPLAGGCAEYMPYGSTGGYGYGGGRTAPRYAQSYVSVPAPAPSQPRSTVARSTVEPVDRTATGAGYAGEVAHVARWTSATAGSRIT